MSSEEFLRDCSGKTCGYAAFSGELGCTDGGNYFTAMLLRANESNFHDATLVKATAQINEILESIPKDENGRRLALLHTPIGTMLAWVRHDLPIPKDAVTAENSDEELIAALGLIQPATSD